MVSEYDSDGEIALFACNGTSTTLSDGRRERKGEQGGEKEEKEMQIVVI